MPEPCRKKYYRVHIAYLIMICTLKQTLSIATLHSMIPVGLSEQEVREIYSAYAEKHRLAAEYFIQQVRLAAGPILAHERTQCALATSETSELISEIAILSGLSRLLAEKLLLLEGKDLDTYPKSALEITKSAHPDAAGK